MPLINLTVSGAYKTHIPWTVVQVETGLTFSQLFSKIVAGAHPRLVIDEELSYSFLFKVHICLTKDSLSIVDEQLNVDDVCAMFGQHFKFIVSQTVHEDAQSASASSTLPNAFEVLMASQKTVDKATLPLKIQERNKKDKLFNDLVSFFESLSGVVVRDHRCGDVIEALYYSAGFEDICVHFAATADLVKVSESSYPMCSVCNQTKEHIKRRKPIV